MNLTCQIYREFNSNYILKKICVKTDLICLLLSAHVSSTLITSSSLSNTLTLCILNIVRLMLNTTSLLRDSCSQNLSALYTQLTHKEND